MITKNIANFESVDDCPIFSHYEEPIQHAFLVWLQYVQLKLLSSNKIIQLSSRPIPFKLMLIYNKTNK